MVLPVKHMKLVGFCERSIMLNLYLACLVFDSSLSKKNCSFYPRCHGGHRESITPVCQRVRLYANAFNSFQLLPKTFDSRATVLLHVSRGLSGSLSALIKGFHSTAFLAIHFSSLRRVWPIQPHFWRLIRTSTERYRIFLKLDFFCMTTTSTLAEVQTPNPILTIFKHK